MVHNRTIVDQLGGMVKELAIWLWRPLALAFVVAVISWLVQQPPMIDPGIKVLFITLPAICIFALDAAHRLDELAEKTE